MSAALAGLAGLWSSVGRDPDALGRVRFSSPDEYLPSAFRVTTAAAASTAAATLAITDLARPSGEAVTIDGRHAAVAFRSEHHLRIDGGPPPDPSSPLAGYYRTAGGGWVQLHAIFEHHRTAALRALGLSEDGVDRATVEAVIAERDAVEVEMAIVEHGGCAAAMRTAAEWRSHPHGAQVDSIAVVELTRLGDAPPEPLRGPPVPGRPLAGVRVLDLTRVIAGPVCGRTLAAHGADVLRVGAARLPSIPALVIDTGFGKRSTHLDLRSPADAEALAALVGAADVFVQGYRPGAVASLGFGPEELAERRPGIVVVSLSAWGRAGPWAGRRGFDSLVQTASGIVEAGSRAFGVDTPLPLPAQALDHASGYLMAFGAAVALRRRVTMGGSWHVRVSLARTGHWITDLGQVDAIGRSDPGLDDVTDLLDAMPSTFGRLTFVRPIVGRWDRPPVPLGTDPPVWL